MTDQQKIELLRDKLMYAFNLMRLTAKPEAADKLSSFSKEVGATLARTRSDR